MADSNNGRLLLLKVSKPEAGSSGEVLVPLSAGRPLQLVLGFDPAVALYELEGNDLSFSFEDGAKVVLRGCFNPAQGLYPDFVLEDGSELDGRELYAILSDSIKLYPSAGSELALGLEAGRPEDLFPADSPQPLPLAAESPAEHAFFAQDGQAESGGNFELSGGSFQLEAGDLNYIINYLLKNNGVL